MADLFGQQTSAQFSWESSLNASLSSLSLLEAATLLLYQTSIDSTGHDVPMASGFSVRMSPQCYFGAALMDLALRGYLRTSARKPLHNYARYNRSLTPSRPQLFLVLALMSLAALSVCVPFALTSVLGPLLIFPISVAGFMLAFIGLMIIAMTQQKLARGVQGPLIVLLESPTGDDVLDEILWHMQPIGSAKSARDWLFHLMRMPTDHLYARIEQRLLEHGWISLTGKQRAPLFGKVETLIINRQSTQWQSFRAHLRQALLSDAPPDPRTTALLIFLALLPGTFQTPLQVRLPGQPAGRTMLGGIYQILSEPAEIAQGRQRLRTLIDGDPNVADHMKPELYDTLLRLRIGVHDSLKRKVNRR